MVQANILIAALVFALAAIVGYAAPEHSTAIIYRLSVFAFVFLVFFSRVISLTIFTPQYSPFEFHQPLRFHQEIPYR